MDQIPELVKQWIGALVRFALTVPLGYLVSKGVITSEMSAETIIALAGLLTTLAWSLWQKWYDSPEGNK